jgi:hypothetical protein
MQEDGTNGFKKIRGKVLVVVGKAGVRRVVGYKAKTNELLLRDEKRPDSKPFPMPVKDMTQVDMVEVRRAAY